MSHVNVAMIGYAFMGKAHSNAWRQVGRFFSPRIEPRMKVICGRDGANVEKAAFRLGWEQAATDWREVIAREDVDIVDICTPGDSHAEIAIAAAGAGKAVFCEKPLANTVAEAEAMMKAVEDAGVVHMICHNYRRAPAIVLAKQLIDAGRIGEIRHYRGTYLQDWIVDPSFPRVWRLQKELAGSGALGDIASHSIDLARYLVGEITAVERPLPDQPDRRGDVTVDDAALALVRFSSGAIGSIEGTRMAPGRRNYNRFEINGSEGSIAFDLERLNELEVFFRNDAPAEQGFRTILATESVHPYAGAWWPPGHIIGWEHTFTHTVFDLLEGIADGRSPQPSFRDGLRNQRVLDAVERAAAERSWIEIR
jgi:predicted dehydrogenase